jgi:hypothetical protein
MSGQDSVPLLGYPDQLLARLRADGYLYFRQLLPPAAVHRVATDINDVLADIGWRPGEASDTSVVAKRGRQEGSEGWWAGYSRIQALQRFHLLAFAPGLRDVRDLLFRSALIHPRKAANLLYPDFGIPAHQEYPSVQGTVDTFAAWVPLQTWPAAAGTLRIARQPGGHRLLPLRALETAGATLALDPGGPWDEIGYTAGDVVLLHSLAVWELTANRTADIALSATYRFQDRDAPVSPASLLPHHYPRVPSARVLSGGWLPHRWIRKPLLYRRAGFVMPRSLETWHEVLPRPASRFVAMADGVS